MFVCWILMPCDAMRHCVAEVRDVEGWQWWLVV